MKTALASLACLGASAVTLAISGTGDTSQSVALFWVGTFVASIVLGIAAIAIAIGSQRASRGRRWALVLLALPSLLAVPVLIAVIMVATSSSSS